MQFKQRFVYIALACLPLLSSVVLLMNAQAQAPMKAQIVFESDRDGSPEIYVMDVDGKNQRNLTDHPNYDRSPDWFDPDFSYAVSPPAN